MRKRLKAIWRFIRWDNTTDPDKVDKHIQLTYWDGT